MDEIAKLAREIDAETGKLERTNSGFCFILLKSSDLASRFHFNHYFQEVRKTLSLSYGGIDFSTVIARKPFLEKDIIWENLQKDQMKAFWKRLVFIVLLMAFSMLIFVPSQVLGLLDALVLDHWRDGPLMPMVSYARNLVVIWINFVVIPCLVDISVMYEEYQTKSELKIVTINRNVCFMLLNTLLIPIGATAGTTNHQALEVLRKLMGNTATADPFYIGSVSDFVSQNLMIHQEHFIKMVINLCFVTNGISMIDGSHRAIRWMSKKWHDRKQKGSTNKTEYEDDFEFELSYYWSYSLVIFNNCLLFCTFVPIISALACLFFYIKYYVDKNNLIFQYYGKHESGGQVPQKVKKYMLFILAFYCAIMISCFSAFDSSLQTQQNFDDVGVNLFSVVGVLIIILWTLFYNFGLTKIEQVHQRVEQDSLIKEEIDKGDCFASNDKHEDFNYQLL